MPMGYTCQLAGVLDSHGYSLVQLILSSSYTGFGTVTLHKDVEQLDELIDALKIRYGSEGVAFVGHSTGTQDTVFYMKHGRNKVCSWSYNPNHRLKDVKKEQHFFVLQPSPVQDFTKFAVLQAPVSDREAMSLDPESPRHIALAQRLKADGK